MELIELLGSVEGDWDGRTRISVTELSGNDQLGLLWGLRSRHYSDDPSARLVYDAQALTPLDAAANTTVASQPVVRHTDLGTNWTPVLGTNISGVDFFLTHTGSYRVWARVYSTSAVPPKLRFVYDVGDLVFPEENAPYAIPGASNFYLVDLGQIRLDPVPVGGHRWQGQIQAKGAGGGENLSIHKLWFQPLDEGAGKLVASSVIVAGLVDRAGRDEFNQTAGALAGKTAPVGGVWAGAGDADDFAVETAGHTAQRTASADADLNTGRYAVSGVAAFANQIVQVDAKLDAPGSTQVDPLYLGVLARYVDTSNWLMATMDWDRFDKGGSGNFLVRMRVAGVVTTLATVPLPSVATYFSATVGTWSYRISVDTGGHWYVWFWATGTEAVRTPIASGQHSSLATGGALATGKPGFYDANVAATGALPRKFDNFLATPLTPDAVLFANQSLELRTDGVYRETADGAASGPITPIGALPRLPPSGLEGRPTELFLLSTRGDFDQLPDTSATDTLSAQKFYRPSWLFVPSV